MTAAASTRRLRPVALLMVGLAVGSLASCGDDAASTDSQVSATDSPAAGVDGDRAGSIVVEDATMDLPANPEIGAVHLIIRNDGDQDDRLVGASSPDADHVSVHRSVVDPEGRATMEPADDLRIAAGSEVMFGHGGLHVMIDGLHRELAVGDTITVVLTFEHAGERTVTAEVVEPQS